ncbi:YkvA family protein, partial [Flavimaricola sp.]
EVSLVARSALKYLAATDDAISDSIGILGLLDDLYVIEWAYAAVEEQAYGLPFLNELQQRAPHLQSSCLTANGMMLDRFGQYVVGNALAVLGRHESDHIVLRDAEAYLAPVIGAVALDAMRASAAEGAKAHWDKGSILNLLNFGQKPERVRYLGHEVIGGKEKIVVEVSQSGRLFLPAEFATNMELPPRQDYKTLSNGRAVSAWQKEHAIDPLHFFLGRRARSDGRRAVLVMAPRNLLEHYLPSLHCRGEPIAKVVGATWISSAEREEPLAYSVIDRAMIYACGSAMVARNLIENPPPGVTAFDLVTLGSQAHKEISAEFEGQEIKGLRMLCLADMSEVPGPPMGALLMEDEVVLPWSLKPRGFRQTDPLARALKRQYNHWTVNRSVRVFPNEALKSISLYLENRLEATKDEFSPIVPQLRTFLFDAGKMPRLSGALSEALRHRAKSLSRATKAEALYDQTLIGIGKALDELSENGKFSPDIFSEIDLDDARPVTILCRSHQEAVETTSMLRERNIDGAGLTATELFRVAPVEHLVVPGWHGAETMRRLDSINPAAKIEYFQFDFQRDWFDRLTSAMRKRSRMFATPLDRSGEGRASEASPTQLIWRAPRRPVQEPPSDPVEFAPVIEQHPELDGMYNSIRSRAQIAGEDDAKGIPVIVEGYRSFLLLPPHAEMVLLNRALRRPEDACVPVSQLREGDVFVLKDGSHRELFQELAPGYLANPEATLKAANIWRQPLKAAFDAGPITWRAFRKRLADVGLQRSELAYRNWISGQTVAPINYREVIPIICSLSHDPLVQQSGDRSVAAVTALYEARKKAAAHVFEQLVGGTTNQVAATLRIELGGTTVVLDIYRIDSVGEAVDCARTLLWQKQSFNDWGRRSIS